MAPSDQVGRASSAVNRSVDGLARERQSHGEQDLRADPGQVDPNSEHVFHAV